MKQSTNLKRSKYELCCLSRNVSSRRSLFPFDNAKLGRFPLPNKYLSVIL